MISGDGINDDESNKTSPAPIWDLILCNDSQDYWYDIESAIKYWIVSHDDNGKTPRSRIMNILNSQKDTLPRTILSAFSSDTAQTEKLIARFIRPLFEARHTWTTSEVANILLSELNKLEKAFSD